MADAAEKVEPENPNAEGDAGDDDDNSPAVVCRIINVTNFVLFI